MVLDPSIKMWLIAEQNRWDLLVPAGKLTDTGERGKEFSPWFGGRKANQPCEISNGVATHCFSRREVGVSS